MKPTEAEYNEQIERISARLREISEARIASGWRPDFAFEDAASQASNPNSRFEATITMMTLGASLLARGWAHSAEFTQWWNAKFSNHHFQRALGFAMPCIVRLPDGETAQLSIGWAEFNKLINERADA